MNAKFFFTLRGLLILLIFTCTVNIESHAQIKINSNGAIGIGTISPNPSVADRLEIKRGYTKFWNESMYNPSPIILEFYMASSKFYPSTNHSGYLGYHTNFWDWAYIDDIRYFNSCTQYSDKKFKENIRDLSESLDKVIQLRGVKYDLIMPTTDEYRGLYQYPHRLLNKFGLIAQEVQTVIPEVVKEDSLGLSIDYISLIPVLIEAIKEQDAEIVKLKIKIKDTEHKMADLEEKSLLSNRKSAGELAGFSADNELLPELFQNEPNPFNENCMIEFYLPSSVQKAFLYVYDFQGKQIMSQIVLEREYGEVLIHGSELQAGMYYYSLLADGQIIGTKEMILIK